MNHKFTTPFWALVFYFGLFQTLWAQNLPTPNPQFAGLPQTLYPSQILHNQSPYYFFSFDTNYTASPYNYSGTDFPAPVPPTGVVKRIREDLYHSSVNPLFIPNEPTFRYMDSVVKVNYQAPITVLNFDYHQMLPWAVDSGWIYFDTTLQVFTTMPDTLWFDRGNNLYHYTANPDSLAALAFQLHEVFVADLTFKSFQFSTDSIAIQFILPTNLFRTNKYPFANAIEMDFADGNGFQPWSKDTSKVVVYTKQMFTEGTSKILRIRLHFGSRVIEAAMKLTIVPKPNPHDLFFQTSSLNFECPINANGFTPKDAWVTIRYGNPQKQLLKPILLVEGFESALRPYGDLTYNSLSAGDIRDEDNEPIFSHLNDMKILFDTLYTLGYDLVYLDFENSRDYIQANSLNVIKTIQYLNAELLANGSNEQLIVLGASMGGLLIRHALTKIEAEGCCHNTRLYATFDSPHNGAHIPIGLQYFVESVRSQDETWDKVLMSPAAQQMLAEHIHAHGQIAHKEWMGLLDSLGHPNGVRRIALISGSERGLAHTINGTDQALVRIQAGMELPYQHHVGTSWGTIQNNFQGIKQVFPFYRFNVYAETRNDGMVFQAEFPIPTYTHPYKIGAILGIHGIFYMAQNFGYATGLLPFMQTVGNNIVLSHQQMANTILPTLHYNPLQHAVYKTQKNLLRTVAPGGQSKTAKDLGLKVNELTGRLDFGLATVPNDRHCFIPSISGLDIDTLDFGMDIDLWSRSPSFNIPFDSYWAPGRGDGEVDKNLLHCEVNQSMIDWLCNEITYQDPITHSKQGFSNPQLATYYNYGQTADLLAPFNNRIAGIDVLEAGRLHINYPSFIGFTLSNEVAPMGQTFKCIAEGGCDTTVVRVKTAGQFIIGHDSTANGAEMLFVNKSKLVLESGGKLIIENNSKLVIDEAGTLELHPGYEIVLNGPNAILEIKGRVVLHANANFITTQGPGFVRLAQNITNASEFSEKWIMEPTSTFAVEASNRASKKLELVGRNQIHGFPAASFTNTKVTFAPSATLELFVPYTINNIWGTSTDSVQKGAGFKLYELPMVVTKSLFSHLEKGLYVQIAQGSTSKFKADSCVMVYNTTGIQVASAPSVELLRCRTDSNEIGVDMTGLGSASKISYHNASFNTIVGASFLAGSSADITVQYSVFNNNDVGVSLIGQANYFLSCSQFRFNNTGAMAYGAKVFPKSSHFEYNQIGFAGGNMLRFFLKNGGNYFRNNAQSCFDIAFAGNAIVDELTNPAGIKVLDVAQNTIQINGSTPCGTATWGGVNLPLYNLGGNFSLLHCKTTLTDLIAGLPQLTVLSLPSLPSGTLRQQIITASNMCDFDEPVGNGQQLIAFNLLADAFEAMHSDHNISEFTFHEATLALLGYEQLKKMLAQAFTAEMLPFTFGEEMPVDPNVSRLILEATRWINSLEQSQLELDSLYPTILAFKFDKVFAYRQGGNYTEALAELEALEGFVAIEDLEKVAYWTCLMELELAVFMGEMDPHAFEDAILECSNLLSNKTTGEAPWNYFKVQDFSVGFISNLTLYPNPAKDGKVSINSTSFEGMVHLELIDVSGKVIYSEDKALFLGNNTLDVSNLAPGIYSLSISSNMENQVFKVVVL